MGVTHCPLCLGLAVLSVVRYTFQALLVWQVSQVAAAEPPLRAPWQLRWRLT